MISSKIYDLIENSLLYKWLEEIEKEDKNGYKKKADNCKKALYGQLSQEQHPLANSFEKALNYYWEDVYYFINIRILNLGIKIGMQLQQEFYEQEKE